MMYETQVDLDTILTLEAGLQRIRIDGPTMDGRQYYNGSLDYLERDALDKVLALAWSVANEAWTEDD